MSNLNPIPTLTTPYNKNEMERRPSAPKLAPENSAAVPTSSIAPPIRRWAVLRLAIDVVYGRRHV